MCFSFYGVQSCCWTACCVHRGNYTVVAHTQNPFHPTSLSSFNHSKPQSAWLSVPSSELGPPIPSHACECCSPSLWVQGERHVLACGGEDGGTQFRRRERHSGTLRIHNLSTHIRNARFFYHRVAFALISSSYMLLNSLCY
jgi:hypothetical protein